jgi:hypothetical protein
MTTPPEPAPDEYAVSPAIGPVPAISVHLSPKRASTRPQHVPIGGTMSDIPAGLRYSTDHLWVRPGAGGLVRAGVTDFAQQSLGDVVTVSPPKPGDPVTAGQACGDIDLSVANERRRSQGSGVIPPPVTSHRPRSSWTS